MNDFEEIAVSTFLSYWPDEIEYSTLLSRLVREEFGENEDSIEIWQPFEYYPGEFIVKCIETLHHCLVKTFQTKV
ncbi:MAG: hypothetical protein H0U57_06725 [Tatlockia sp.]|nr:hypothetical protein [Tatlockia sp.]